MNIRSKRVVAISLVLSALVISSIAYYYFFMRPQPEEHNHSHAPSAYRRIVDPPKKAYAFNLTDQFGQRKGLNDWKGKIVLLSFIYTRCPTVCPILATNFVQIQNELGDMIPDHVVLVFVTVDPEYDTTEKLAAWTNAYNGKWLALTGTLDECKEVWSKYGVYVAKQNGEVGHTTKTVLIDQNGMVRFEYYGYPLDAEQTKHDIHALMGH